MKFTQQEIDLADNYLNSLERNDMFPVRPAIGEAFVEGMRTEHSQSVIPLLVALKSVDDLLSRLEDHTDGKDGVDITMMRGEIQEELKQLNIK